MGETELIFDAKEMKVIQVTCANCGLGIVFDCTNEKARPPAQCPGCNLIDQEMYSWLTGYQKWYIAIVGSKKAFHFRVTSK